MILPVLQVGKLRPRVVKFAQDHTAHPSRARAGLRRSDPSPRPVHYLPPFPQVGGRVYPLPGHAQPMDTGRTPRPRVPTRRQGYGLHTDGDPWAFLLGVLGWTG